MAEEHLRKHMAQQMARNIHREVLKGQVADSGVVRVRATWEKTLEDSMRDSGYVPCLDLDTVFTTSYVAEKEHFDCELVMYFMYVGKKKSWQVEGVSAGRTIPMSTPSKKSEPSLTP